MKTLVEIPNEGLEALLNKKVLVMCMNYFYTGVLSGVNDKFIKLDNPSIVYETGSWKEKGWRDAQALGDEPQYVFISSIESFREVKD